MRPIRLALAAVMAAAGLTACEGSANNPNTQNGGGGGTLTIQGDAGNPTLIQNFNPLQPSTALHGVHLIYEPMEIASPVDGSFTPFLATEHKFTDPTTLVFTLRDGVKWSDGQDFDSADVVFTFQLLKKFPALDGNGIWQQISDVTANGKDVTVKFKAPNVPFANIVAAQAIVPEHLWSGVADPVKHPNAQPVGTGPFQLDQFAPTQYTLKKHESYWQKDKIVPTQVVFPAQSSNQNTNQLDVTSGKFDWAYTFIPDVKRTFTDRDPKNVYWFPPGGAICLYLNLTKAPFDDANFRKGVSLSLDRTSIAQKAVNGLLEQASMSGLILPNLEKWLDPSLPNKGNVSKDQAAATAAFQQAGYRMQGNRLVGPNGQQASMSIVMPNNFSDWVAAAKEVSTQLQAAGIATTLDLPQFAQYQQSIQAGTFNAAMGGYGGTGHPYTDFNNALNSKFAAPVNTPTANNFQRYKNPQVDAALNELASATDEAAQRQAAFKLQQVMYNEAPMIPLYYGGSWGLFTTKNFTGWPSASDPYTLPTNYNNSLLLVVTRLKKA